MFLGMKPNPTAWLANKPLAIDREVKSIETAHQQALDILEHNRDLLETITNQLLGTSR